MPNLTPWIEGGTARKEDKENWSSDGRLTEWYTTTILTDGKFIFSVTVGSQSLLNLLDYESAGVLVAVS